VLRDSAVASSGSSSVPGCGKRPAVERQGASAADVFAVAAGLVERLWREQAAAIAAAGELLATRLLAGGNAYVFGTGHSRITAMELAGRAGGLAGIRELVLEDMVAHGQATKDELADGTLERRPDAALALLQRVAVSPDDTFIVVSHSGCNGAPVEMALQARRRDLPVVAVTSLEHSRTVCSRHPSGLRLFEVATISIDTCAPYADTAIRLPSQLGVCSVSSFAGVLVAQALTAEVVSRYLRAGVTPPLLVSRNLPGT
jgi:uncharacterized phosphosugar-binding protein